MTSTELATLAARGHLKEEPPVQAELDGLPRSGEARLKDARWSELSFESRFDLAYNAAHAFALAAHATQGREAGVLLEQSEDLLRLKQELQ